MSRIYLVKRGSTVPLFISPQIPDFWFKTALPGSTDFPIWKSICLFLHPSRPAAPTWPKTSTHRLLPTPEADHAVLAVVIFARWMVEDLWVPIAMINDLTGSLIRDRLRWCPLISAILPRSHRIGVRPQPCLCRPGLDLQWQPARADWNLAIALTHPRQAIFDQRLIYVDISDIDHSHSHDPVIAIDIHLNDAHLLSEHQVRDKFLGPVASILAALWGIDSI